MKESSAIKQQSKDIQCALAHLGYFYEIEHVRPVHNFVVVKEEADGHIEYDNCLSRDEFNVAVEELHYIAPANIPMVYGCFVCTTGGFTRVTIARKDGSTVIGKHNFRLRDNFFKNLGFCKAVFKAVGSEISPILDEMNKQVKDRRAEFNKLNKE